MKYPDMTMREYFESLNTGIPAHQLLTEYAIEICEGFGVADTKKKDVPSIVRWKITINLFKEGLRIFGMMPGGQLLVLIFMSLVFLPIYWALTH